MQLITSKAKSLTLATCSLVSLALTLRAVSSAEPHLPRSDFQFFDALQQSQLRSLQAKLTYVGIQGKPCPSIIIAEDTIEPDISVFDTIRSPGIDYSNDSVPPRTWAASVIELEDMLNRIATLPGVTQGEVPNTPYVSFALFSPIQGGVSFEAVLTQPDAADLLQAVRTSFLQNRAARAEISWLSCALSLQEAGIPVDITSSVVIRIDGLRLRRSDGTFVGALTVTNQSATPYPGPVSVALSFPSGMDVVAYDGLTCQYAPQGRRYVDVVPAGMTLSAGETIRTGVAITNQDLVAVSFTAQALSGVGAR